MTGRAGLLLLVILPVAGGCAASVARLSVPDPPATTVPAPPPPETLPPGLASVAETPVAGVTTTTSPAIGPGTSSLGGVVTDPGGAPLPGATVQIDRVVGNVYVSAQTKTAADGSWSFRGINGGIYRIRAWLAPQLDMPRPEVLFLAAGQSTSVTLQETSYSGQQVQASVNPASPVLDQPANLVVQVTEPSVGSDGVLSYPPVAGAPVTLVNGPGWQVLNGNPINTDPAGQALFTVVCTQVGTDPLGAQVGNSSPVSLQMPDCGAPPPPTTTTTTLFSQTTTTCPPTLATTTTLQFGSNC